MIKLEDKRIMEFCYTSEEEMKEHEETMISDGWLISKKKSQYSQFWRLYSKQKE